MIEVIPQYCTAHPVLRIRLISTRSFREYGIVFQSKDQVKGTMVFNS